MRHSQHGAGLSEFLQGRVIGREPFFKGTVPCHGPSPDKRAPRPVIIEPIFFAQGAGFLGDSERGLRLASELVQHCEVIERNCNAEGVRDFPGERKPFLGCLQGAIRIAEMPVAVADILRGRRRPY